PDADLAFPSVTGRSGERSPRHAGDDPLDVRQKSPYLLRRPRDHKRLGDFDIRFRSAEAEVGVAEGRARSCAVYGGDRCRGRTDESLRMLRSDRAQASALTSVRGGNIAELMLLENAADGTHDADISGAAAQ